jgi:hypothetical protein
LAFGEVGQSLRPWIEAESRASGTEWSGEDEVFVCGSTGLALPPETKACNYDLIRKLAAVGIGVLMGSRMRVLTLTRIESYLCTS